MKIELHPHAQDRMSERGISREEVVEAIEQGERFQARYGREGFRKNFVFGGIWRGRHYAMKQVEAYTVREDDSTIVITELAKYYSGEP